MKNLFKTVLLLAVTFCWTHSLQSQVWSGSNQNQTTNRTGNVGIGSTSPQGRLQISRTQSQDIAIFDPTNSVPPPAAVPHIRFNTFQEKSGEILGSTVWDIDASGSMNFKYVNNANSTPSLAMSLSQSGGLTVHGNRLTVGNSNMRMNAGLGTSLFGVPAYHIGFGLNQSLGGADGTFFNFYGSGGAVIQGDSDGNLLFLSKPADGDYTIGINENLNYARMIIQSDGKVSLGTTSTPDFADSNQDYKLYVNGGILSKEMRLRTGWADYVFESNYNLLTLKEVENHIQENGHLHHTPSAIEIEANGLDVGKITVNQQEKIEELFLHLIEMNKRIEKLEKENKILKSLLKKDK